MAGSMHGGDSDEPIAEINVVPLVDIILVVLIIFMVTAPLVLKPTIEMNLPQASSGEQKQAPKTLEILISKTGSLYYDGKEVNIDQLKEQVSTEAQANADSSVILTADKDVTLDGLTPVIDAIKSAGIKKLGFSVKSK
jgi:biopolymer transport protein ExbD